MGSRNQERWAFDRRCWATYLGKLDMKKLAGTPTAFCMDTAVRATVEVGDLMREINPWSKPARSPARRAGAH